MIRCQPEISASALPNAVAAIEEDPQGRNFLLCAKSGIAITPSPADRDMPVGGFVKILFGRKARLDIPIVATPHRGAYNRPFDKKVVSFTLEQRRLFIGWGIVTVMPSVLVPRAKIPPVDKPEVVDIT